MCCSAWRQEAGGYLAGVCVLQCVAVCCSVLQCVTTKSKRLSGWYVFVAVYCNFVEGCCSAWWQKIRGYLASTCALQCVVVCCSVLQCVATRSRRLSGQFVCGADCCCMLHCVAVCGAMCCGVWQSVAVCCSLLQCFIMKRRSPSGRYTSVF